MKKNIHPEYHSIIIQFTDGSKIETRSTWGKAGDIMILDIDSKTHPAWTGVQKLMDNTGRISKFNHRFAGITFNKE